MRSLKTGIDYFPLDVDFFIDDKIQFVSAKYGLIGEAIVIRLLCKIYRNGYYMNWGEDECLLFSKTAGVDPDRTREVIEELLSRGFLDDSIYKRYGILTSKGIQKRFLKITWRRKDVSVCKDYFIADINGYNVNIYPLNDNKSTYISKESKESKESKVSKNYEKDNKIPEWIDKDIWIDFIEMRKKMKAIPTDKAKDLLIKELEKLKSDGNNPNEVLNQSIMNNWKGVFALKGAIGGKNQGYTKQNRRLPERHSYTDPDALLHD